MLRVLVTRWYFLKFSYGEKLEDYPLIVSIKMLLSRFAFVSLLPLILPDKHIPINYYGAKLYMNLRRSPVWMDIAMRVYEYWKTKLLFDLVREGMNTVDVGAWEGNYSILFARLMLGKGKVLAFEPDPDNCARINKNIQVNNCKCIEVFQCALADNEGSATFYPAGCLGSLVYYPGLKHPEKREPITVQTRTLDNVLDGEDIHHVDIIKIDVEGSDLLVLKGAERTLTSSRVHLLMDLHMTSNSERKELFTLLTNYGFEIYRIGKRFKRIKTADELFLFSDDASGDRLISDCDTVPHSLSFQNRLKGIIPAILRMILSSLYILLVQFMPSQTETQQWVREIYARKPYQNSCLPREL